MKLLLSWFLSALLTGYIALSPSPTLASPPVAPDYMYDLDEDGIGNENGIDFGSPFEPTLTFTSFANHHKHDIEEEQKQNVKKMKNNSSPTSVNGTGHNYLPDDDDHDDNHPKSASSISATEDSSREQSSGIINVSIIRNRDKFDKFQSKLSKSGDYVFGSLLVAFCLISLVGNSCIIIVFCFRHRRLCPAEVFLINLGIVDVLLSIASYPMSMTASFKHRWIFGEFGCTLYAFVCYFLGIASIFSILAIALIRYLKTCTPAQGNQITCWTSCKMIAWSYLVALIWAVVPFFGFGNYGTEPYGLSCTLDWVAKDKASRIYIILVTIFCVFLPLLIILFCYSQIIKLVKQSDALMRNNGVNKRNLKGSDIQLTVVSGLVTAGFIIGWGPYTLVSLWATYRGEVVLPMWATPIPVLMAKSSIAYNPLIYIFFTTRYRDDFLALLQHWIYSQAKGNKGNCNNNNNGTAMIRKKSMKTSPGNGSTENNSPVGSGSSSLVTRQMTSTTVTQLTASLANAVTTANGSVQLQNLGNNTKDIVEAVDEFDDDDNDYTDDDDDDQLHTRQETRILIVQQTENHSMRQSHSSHVIVPSHVITMISGNGTSTVISTNRKKFASATSSLLSLRSSSSLEAEQQV